MLTPRDFENRRSLIARLGVLRYTIVACMGLLAISFWVLQVVQNRKYAEMAENNKMRTIPLRAPRGVLFDRHGRVLVENRDSFTIAIVRERTRNLDHTIKTLARVTLVPEQTIRDAVDRRRRDPVFRPIPVIEHASDSQVARVYARQVELPGVVVQRLPTRSYPPDRLAAHLFGYVSEIQESQIDRPEYAGLTAGAIVGQAGVERIHNAALMGRDGDEYVVVNSVGRIITELERVEPVEGKRLQLTIDLDLQRALEEAFRTYGYAGAAAFLDPRTGEVLAMTSLPAYDPNDFVAGLDPAKWEQLNKDPLKPLENRLIRGRYSPGSTFKIVMAITALAEGVITPNFRVTCTGSKSFYGRPFACHRKEGHGTVDLRTAIAQSCNVYFYTVGDLLKIDTIHAYGQKLGLVGRTGIDLPGELENLVPSTEWKQRTQGEPWYPGETISVSIGQGAVSVTPLALATMVATVANGGRLVTPQLVHATEENGTWRRVPTTAPRSTLAIKPSDLRAVQEGMWLAVNGGGTAGRGRIEGRDVSGKTGTAQVISLEGARAAAGRTKKDLRDHGWFIFFAPRDNPRIAGVVFAEHAEHGHFAAPIAKYVMEMFFAKEEGRPLPTLTPPVRTAIGAPAPERRQ